MQGPNGVVLCMKAKEKGVHRYENDGAFNILFNMGQSIIIELVGKGFDGHELTQGLALHEYYIIPWEKVLFMGNRKDLEKDEDVIKRFVDSKAYVCTGTSGFGPWGSTAARACCCCRCAGIRG